MKSREFLQVLYYYFLVPYLGFLDDLYSKQLILQRINDDHHMSKVSVDDTMSVIPIVLRPHNVNLVVTNMTNLKQGRCTQALRQGSRILKKIILKFSSSSFVIRVNLVHP